MLNQFNPHVKTDTPPAHLRPPPTHLRPKKNCIFADDKKRPDGHKFYDYGKN